MRRVVITGLGVVSCLGNNQEEVHQSLLKTKSGISFSEEYKEHNLKSHVCQCAIVFLGNFFFSNLNKNYNLLKTQTFSFQISNLNRIYNLLPQSSKLSLFKCQTFLHGANTERNFLPNTGCLDFLLLVRFLHISVC